MHVDMVVTVLYVLDLLQKFKSLVNIFEIKVFFSSTLITILLEFFQLLLVVVFLLSKWIDTWVGTTNTGNKNTVLGGTRNLLLLALPILSIFRSMIFHMKSTENTSCILRPKLIQQPQLLSSKKKRRSELFGRHRSVYGRRCSSLFFYVPLTLLVLFNMPLNVDGLDEVGFVKLHVRLREVLKNEFPKSSSVTSNDVFQPLLLPHTNSTIPVNRNLLHHNTSNATSSRQRFISNRIVNKWFYIDVNSASQQQEKFEAFRSELKNGNYFKNKTIECIEMYLCFLAMGCFLAYLGVNVIPWVCLDIYFYFRKRRIEKKIIKFKRKRGFSEKIKGKETSAGKSRWTYTNRLGSLFSSSLVSLCLVALCNVLEGVDAYAKMPNGCVGINWSDRSCYPRKAIDDLEADGCHNLNACLYSGTHATYGPMKDWDMSEVTDISNLFRQKYTLNADLSSWDVSSVTAMEEST